MKKLSTIQWAAVLAGTMALVWMAAGCAAINTAAGVVAGVIRAA